MALRAGYIGIKKNIVGIINSLAGSKIIKTIGDGLNLTAAGKLNCVIDPDTMEIKAGKLSSKGAGIVYAETEYDTHKKWLNGETIYGIVKTDLLLPANSYNLNVRISGAARVLSIHAICSSVGETGTNTTYYTQTVDGDDILLHPTDSLAAHTVDLIVEYLKNDI